MENNNFDYERFEMLEKKIKELETQNKVIINENNKLKAAIAIKPISTHSNKERSLVNLLSPKVYNYLFDYNVDEKTGELLKNVKIERKNGNFTNFYRYILQTIKPVAKANCGNKDKFLAKNPNFYELNDREWEVFKTAMFKIIEITLRAKLGFSEKFNKFSVEQIFKLSEDKIKEILTDGTEKQITFCWANNNEKGV